MTAVSDILLRPALPIEVVIALGLIGLALVGFAATRRLKGALLRFGALAALVLALLDPALLTEEREGLSDVVALIVDESGSQDLEDRAAAAGAAAEAVEAQIRALAEAGGRAAPIELRVARVKGDGAEGTRLVSALGEAISDVAPERVAGAILITDGVASDGELRPGGLQPVDPAADVAGDAVPAPVHVLLTGREDEFDRRLVVETAPGFGLVGEPVSVRFRVEESLGPNGAAPEEAGVPRVRAFVDGEPAAAGFAPVGRSTELRFPLTHPGATVVELRLEGVEGELTERNNVAAFTINGVRDRLRVLLVSGEPHAGERTWRNLLKADPAVDLVHFTILRPPRKQSMASVTELALIPFPTRELFEEKLDEFDLIVFDRYRRWGILETRFIRNIADYVRKGGAVLVSTGPAFAGVDSMYRTPLRDVLPAAPTNDILENAYRPAITTLGARHPVTRGLPGPRDAEGAPLWGRWFRLVEVATLSGDVVMEGPGARPLLILDRVGEGRVSMLASDHVWLWARGYDGGGPQVELLRRLAHWLMKEPELEEEALTAKPTPGGFEIERRSLAEGEKSVVVSAPDGERETVALAPAGDGLWRAVVETETLGLHRIEDAPESVIVAEDLSADGAAPAERAPLKAVAVVGPPSPEEFADPVSRIDPLEGLVEATGGGVVRLKADGTPDIRRVAEGATAEGGGWIGLVRREAYEVTGVSLGALLPAWAFFALAALFSVFAWRVEGR